MPKFVDLTGTTPKVLTVLGLDEEKTKNKKRKYWKCRCTNCGNMTSVQTHCVKTQGGCSHCTGVAIVRHGLSTEEIFKRYRSMYGRVFNSKYYDDIGICNRWLGEFGVIKFKQDMGPSFDAHAAIHGVENTTLDRINPFKDYSPENCKWATWEEQARNKRRDHLKREKENVA